MHFRFKAARDAVQRGFSLPDGLSVFAENKNFIDHFLFLLLPGEIINIEPLFMLIILACKILFFLLFFLTCSLWILRAIPKATNSYDYSNHIYASPNLLIAPIYSFIFSAPITHQCYKSSLFIRININM